jgi:hypothetical protein
MEALHQFGIPSNRVCGHPPLCAVKDGVHTIKLRLDWHDIAAKMRWW